MAKKAEIGELVDKDLNGFKIIEMTEVFRTNEDGMKTNSLGFFKDSNIAEAFVETQADANWCKTGKDFVLTDGNVGYVITKRESIKLFDDEVEKLEIRKKVIAKFSPAERKLFGFPL